MPDVTLPPYLPALTSAYMPRIIGPGDTDGGCPATDPYLGRCTRPPHTDPRHKTCWDGAEAAWTT